MNKKIRDIIIVVSILICLLGIYITKKKNLENYEVKPGFELNVDDNFDMLEETKKGYPIMVMIGSQGCQSCREMYPTLVLLNKQYNGKLLVKYLDISKYGEAKKQFNFRMTPTILFFNKKGKLKSVHEGFAKKKQIMDIFESIGVNL